MSNNKKGMFVILAGPSGSGKGEIGRAIRKRHSDYILAKSFTTRPPRVNEKNGECYFFVTEEEFKNAVDDGKLLEWAVIHNNQMSGAIKQPIMDGIASGHVVMREMEFKGIESVSKIFDKDDLLVIFIAVSSWRELKRRILLRSPMSPEELEKRHNSYRHELVLAKKYANYVVMNERDNLDKAIDRVDAIISEAFKKR